jgi:hypothetical protein
MSPPDLCTMLTALHDSEINGEISWFFDRVWDDRLCDPLASTTIRAVTSPLDRLAPLIDERQRPEA